MKPVRYVAVAVFVALLAVLPAAGVFSASSGAGGSGVGGGGGGGGSWSSADPEQEALNYFEKGQAYVEQKNYGRDVSMFKRAISYKKDFPEAYNMLGYSLRKDGKPEKAIKSYKKALALNPDFAEAHEYIGEAYLSLGDRESAWKHCTILVGLGSEQAGELLEKIEAFDGSRG